MDENKLKMLLGKEYTENPIVNFQLYWIKGKETCPTPEKLYHKPYEELNYKERSEYERVYDEWRISNDLDVIHLNGDLNADTIFSVWMPLKMCLQSAPTYPYCEQGNDEKPYKGKPYLPNIIKNIDKYLPYNEWKELYKFASLASTKANVMKLPDSGMQNRGKLYFDQMPKTLYECFEEGIYAEYFKKIEITTWVRKQNLIMFFENEEFSRQNIKPLISRMKSSEFEWLKDRAEIKEMLINFNSILEMRMGS